MKTRKSDNVECWSGYTAISISLVEEKIGKVNLKNNYREIKVIPTYYNIDKPKNIIMRKRNKHVKTTYMYLFSIICMVGETKFIKRKSSKHLNGLGEASLCQKKIQNFTLHEYFIEQRTNCSQTGRFQNQKWERNSTLSSHCSVYKAWPREYIVLSLVTRNFFP